MRSFPNLVKLAGILFLLAGISLLAEAAAQAPAKPAHRVIACYFHRTVRCPTCLKISSYIEGALKTGLAGELKNGQVEWLQIDFQDPKNQKIITSYQIEDPTLVIMNVNNNQVTSWKTAPKVWSLVGNRDAFYDYVQKEVRGYLNAR